jgi:hypothetical protein
MSSGHRSWRTVPDAVVNAAVLEFELFSGSHGYAANPLELRCMDESLADMRLRQAGYSAGAAASMLAATQVKLFTIGGTRMRLPIVARLMATAGAAYFASDVATFHASRHLLSELTALGPASPIGEHLQRKFGIASPSDDLAGVKAGVQASVQAQATSRLQAALTQPAFLADGGKWGS